MPGYWSSRQCQSRLLYISCASWPVVSSKQQALIDIPPSASVRQPDDVGKQWVKLSGRCRLVPTPARRLAERRRCAAGLHACRVERDSNSSKLVRMADRRTLELRRAADA